MHFIGFDHLLIRRCARHVLVCFAAGCFFAANSMQVLGQEVVRDPFFGLHIHNSDRGTAWPKARFGAWRLWDASVAWPDLEPRRGRWDFARLDRYVAFGERFGIDILLPLGLSPNWASARPNEKSAYNQPGYAAEPADLKDWNRYVRTVAERYLGRIRHYDVWNEVNEAGFFSGSLKKMVELTCEAQKVLREVSPENKVVSPSMIGVGVVPDRFEEFLSLGGKDCIDIVGYHFYVPHREPEEIVDLVRRIRAVMLRQGLAAIPLWNTESGWWFENADGSSEAAADRRWRRITSSEGPAVVARSLILGRWAGLERFYWYAWDNNVLGLIEPTSRETKPAGVAYETLVRWMSGKRPDCATTADRWVCRLPSTSPEILRLAWRTGVGPSEFALPSAERLISVERLDGSDDVEPEGVAARRSLPLGREPVLIRSTLPRLLRR